MHIRLVDNTPNFKKLDISKVVNEKSLKMVEREKDLLWTEAHTHFCDIKLSSFKDDWSGYEYLKIHVIPHVERTNILSKIFNNKGKKTINILDCYSIVDEVGQIIRKLGK